MSKTVAGFACNPEQGEGRAEWLAESDEVAILRMGSMRNTSGGDAPGGNTRFHPEHDG